MDIRGLRAFRGLAVAAVGGLLAVALANPVGAQTAGDAPGPFDVSVTAEVVGTGAPITVDTTAVTEDADGRLTHGVEVTWTDSANAVLGDERFTNHVSAQDGEGDLVTAGRGCGASWSELEREVIHPCTLDFHAYPVSTGDTHEYPVAIHPEVGPLRLAAGTYVVDQVVSWWRPATEDLQQQVTIRLTYEVTAREIPLDIDVAAAIVEAGAPVSVDVTAPASGDAGVWAHGVRVTWNGTGTATLDDARFSHHVTATGGGDLITAGRGCAPNWDDTAQELFTACTADLQIIELTSGETHEYPVRVYPRLGTLALEPGVYVVDEKIGWQASADGPRQEFTVRLTYTVTEGVGGSGILTPEPAASGVSTAVWSGGSVEQLPDAESYWVTVDGSYVSYRPDAPDFVNARFLELYAGGIPAGTALTVVR